MNTQHAISSAQARAVMQTYVKAKDENRPWFMAEAFYPAATVEMSVLTDSISFPAKMEGLEAVTDTLVRKFGQSYENVHTYCLDAYAEPKDNLFSCDWLVVMSEKASGNVRVGCGRYDWRFVHRERWLVAGLHITIAAMAVLPSSELASVMDWAMRLPYPWIGNEQVLVYMPERPALEPVRAYLEVRKTETAVASM